MSVFITGMEMPTSCAGCFNRGCGLWREVVLPAHQRHKYCPLVPVPKHGRLIDADALLSQYKGNVWTAKTDYAEGLRDVAKDVQAAPTIITAEEGE